MNKFDETKFKMGYFIQYFANEGKFSRLIMEKQLEKGFKDDSDYTHVEVSGGGNHSINIAPPISKLVDITKKHKNRYARLIRYRNDNYEKKGRYKVAYFSATLNNTGYDIRGIARFMFKWIGHDNRLYFCSEGCLHSLQMVYPEAINYLLPEKCMPAHFSDPKYFEIVWEGRIAKDNPM
jgi:hypothetical protein